MSETCRPIVGLLKLRKEVEFVNPDDLKVFMNNINIEKVTENSPIDLNKIIRKMLSNYVNLLLKERFLDKYDLLCCLDSKGYFTYICPNHFKVMGFTSQELRGMNGFEIIHPDDIEKMSHLMVDINLTKRPIEMTYRIKHKQGHWLGMKTICTPYIVDGEVIALINFSSPYIKKIENI